MDSSTATDQSDYASIHSDIQSRQKLYTRSADVLYNDLQYSGSRYTDETGSFILEGISPRSWRAPRTTSA